MLYEEKLRQLIQYVGRASSLLDKEISSALDRCKQVVIEGLSVLVPDLSHSVIFPYKNPIYIFDIRGLQHQQKIFYSTAFLSIKISQTSATIFE